MSVVDGMRPAVEGAAKSRDSAVRLADNLDGAVTDIEMRTYMSTPDGRRLVRALRDAHRNARRMARVADTLRRDLERVADAADACAALEG